MLSEYDIDLLKKARKVISVVAEYNYGDSQNKSESNRLETILKKLDCLIERKAGKEKTA